MTTDTRNALLIIEGTLAHPVSKIQQAFAWRTEKNLRYRIEADGGINFQTAGECAHAGADTFVSGTGLFGQPSLKRAISKMRKIVDKNSPIKQLKVELDDGVLLASDS